MEKPDDIFADGKEIFAGSHHRELDPIVRLLAEHGIPHKILAPGSKFNPSYAFSKDPDAIRLIVPATDYEQARKLLIEQGWIGNVSEEEGYREMLQDLDDEELMEYVLDEKRYDPAQVAMAKTILKERGRNLSDTTIKELRNVTANVQRESMTISTVWLILWIVVSFILPVLGAIISFAIMRGTGRDVNGENYYFYHEGYRKTALTLLRVSLSVIILAILIVWYYQTQF